MGSALAKPIAPRSNSGERFGFRNELAADRYGVSSDSFSRGLITEYGKPFTANGFGNKFKDWCRQANLPHCSAHGVRKATATALAEAGATPHQIMAITGHQSLEEVERYTKAANRLIGANEAMLKLRK